MVKCARILYLQGPCHLVFLSQFIMFCQVCRPDPSVFCVLCLLTCLFVKGYLPKLLKLLHLRGVYLLPSPFAPTLPHISHYYLLPAHPQLLPMHAKYI